jgi:serine phosphatase RsbU (regulator of sigma subunit)/anti-sigma regulatory factor (Ser/Thr protein kinase)
MAARLGQWWRSFRGRATRTMAAHAEHAIATTQQPVAAAIDIPPNDPLMNYFITAPGVVELDKLNLQSPALTSLKAAGVKLAVPLVSQGELIGVLNLGPRRSSQEYSLDDRTLLNNLAIQAAPAVRVAQLVRQQQAEIAARERIENELRVARLIQQSLLPKQLPVATGWRFAARYQPARAVGGDFYDFVELPDGTLGLMVGDVTDKGVPAALVMATTRSILRTAAQRLASPGEVLQRTNDALCGDIPPNMFVTCLYAILDPATGRVKYANAGHDLPFLRHGSGVSELRARGMPLGLMPDMIYEEKEVVVAPGDRVLFYSDGLVEAHNAEREMLGFPRLEALMGEIDATPDDVIEQLLLALEQWTGQDWEQEDDITLVVLEREAAATVHAVSTDSKKEAGMTPWRRLEYWTVPSEAGNERQVMARVGSIAAGLDLPKRKLQRLQTAVSEAVMNAIEHGNKYQPELPVEVEVLTNETQFAVRISDQDGKTPNQEAEIPDLEAKLAGLQSPRGWGLFLIKNLVDEMNVSSDQVRHTVELVFHLEDPDDVS